MRKKYKSKAHLLNIVVKVDNKNRHIEFVRENLGDGIIGCSYTTGDKGIQEAIEAHEYFNRALFPSIWTDVVEEVIVEDKPIEVKKVGRKKKG